MKKTDKQIHFLGDKPEIESTEDKQTFQLHPQAISAVMVALNFSIMAALLDKEDDKVDLGEVMSNWTLSVDPDTGWLKIDNPPTYTWEEVNKDKVEQLVGEVQ